MIRSEISAAIAKNYSVSIREADKIVAGVFDVIKSALLKREKVAIRGFGSFNIVRRKGHIGQDLRNKRSIIIPDHNVIVFAPAENILKHINKTPEK